jgi:hypothetical protein
MLSLFRRRYAATLLPYYDSAMLSRFSIRFSLAACRSAIFADSRDFRRHAAFLLLLLLLMPRFHALSPCCHHYFIISFRYDTLTPPIRLSPLAFSGPLPLPDTPR